MQIWGCCHKKLTFPMTRPSKATRGRRRKNTYVTCLECGKEIPYVWNEMRVVKERRKPNQEASSGQHVIPQGNLMKRLKTDLGKLVVRARS